MARAFISKYNSKRKNQVILLMIIDGKRWHYLAVKSLPALLKGTTSHHNGDFYCLNCFYSYSAKNKLKKHEIVCYDHDYCYVEMPNENNKIYIYIFSYQGNIKIEPWRKVIKSSVYDLC